MNNESNCVHQLTRIFMLIKNVVIPFKDPTFDNKRMMLNRKWDGKWEHDVNSNMKKIGNGCASSTDILIVRSRILEWEPWSHLVNYLQIISHNKGKNLIFCSTIQFLLVHFSPVNLVAADIHTLHQGNQNILWNI